MDDVDAELPDQAHQRHRVAAHDQRVFRGERQGQMRRTCPRDFALQRAALGGDIGGPSRLDQRSREFDGAALGAAGDETREDLQHHRRAPCRRSGHDAIVDAHSAGRISPMSSPATSNTPGWCNNRLPPARRIGPGRRVPRRVPLRHDRHQGPVISRIIAAAAGRPICGSTISAMAHRAAMPRWARSAAGRRTRLRFSIR